MMNSMKKVRDMIKAGIERDTNLLRGKFSIDLKYLIESIKEGSPSAFKNISSIIFNTFVNNLIARVGTTDAIATFLFAW